MHRVLALVVAVLALAALPATSASAADHRTVVSHNVSWTEVFPDDICGPRENTTTFTAKMMQTRLIERPDGSFSYRDVATVTYVSDFADPTIEDLTGRLTEVNHFILTPAGNFTGTSTFHDFLGSIKIFVRVNLKVVNGEVLVDREITKVTGCP
jgi:hypothetical protein